MTKPNKIMKKYFDDVVLIILLPSILVPVALAKDLKIFFICIPLVLFAIKMCGYPIDIFFRIKNYINKKLICSGIELELKVNDIYIKPLKSNYSRIYSYYFYYKSIYKDQKNKKYIFRSMPYKTIYDTKSSIPKIKKVKVFINAKNPKKYYMQINE